MVPAGIHGDHGLLVHPAVGLDSSQDADPVPNQYLIRVDNILVFRFRRSSVLEVFVQVSIRPYLGLLI